MRSRITIEQKVLTENDRRAAAIRQKLQSARIVALNLVSSPGSGKTSLLERTLAALNSEFGIALVAGDVQTENDAARLAAAGGRIVRPIVTGGACHLDARMVGNVIDELDLTGIDLLIVENVGNLVCPSNYDLGEDMKVVLISTTEGDDKPSKYPAMFRKSAVMIINKIDLLGMSEFRVATVRENALTINGELTILEMSCRTGEGLETWFQWLRDLISRKKSILPGT